MKAHSFLSNNLFQNSNKICTRHCFWTEKNFMIFGTKNFLITGSELENKY